MAVNAGLTLLYWRIGQRFRTQVRGGQRARYGQEILPTLSAESVPRYGRGFSDKSLRHTVRCAEELPGAEIVSALPRQSAWSHFLELI